MEADEAAGVVTKFIVKPLRDGVLVRVTIVSGFRSSPGMKGGIKQLFTPLVVHQIYVNELRRRPTA